MKNMITINNDLELEQIRNLFEGTLQQSSVPAVVDNLRADDAIISLIQPKSVTFSVFSDDRFQEEVLTETVRCLQPFMTKNPLECISQNNVESLFVSVDFSQVSGFHRDRALIENNLKQLESLRFEFKWVQKGFVNNDGKEVPEKEFRYSGMMFIGHFAEEGVNNYHYRLHLNPLSLPYLTFIGKGVGFTEFDYSIYRQSKSVYVKKLYKLLCEWSNLGPQFNISLNDFKERLGLKSSYSISQINTRILKETQALLEKTKSKLKFEYEISSTPDENESFGFKKNVKNRLSFYIYTPGSNTTRLVEKKINALKNILLSLADKEKISSVPAVVNAIVDAGLLDKVLNKCQHYSHMMNKGQMTDVKLRNTLLKIIRQTIPGADLRSSEHVRNANMKKVRAKYSAN